MLKDNFLNPQLKEEPADVPAASGLDWNAIIEQLLKSGATVASAVLMANAQTGKNNTAAQVPQYIINQVPNTNQGNNQNNNGNSNNNAAPKTSIQTVFGMSTEVVVIVVVGLLLVAGFAFYYFKNKK